MNRFQLTTFLFTSLATLGSVQALACPAGVDSVGVVNGRETCVLKGVYLRNLTLTANKNWLLQGGVFIGQDNGMSATLSIQAGTTIFGQSGADFLVIHRGSKIVAQGTAERPIVFTSGKTSNRTRGLWGGLIINGRAPINSCMPGSAGICEAEGEGSTGRYGGNDPHDSSGVLRYVRVEFAGYQITPDNELNGIAFQGVGDGTEVDYLQAHMNADDGVEFFGGTVNVKHLVLTGNGDDAFDWTSGWQGKAQYVIVQQYDDESNNGIEADNLESPMNASPRSEPELANFTIIGSTTGAGKSGNGILLRRGTGAHFYNTVVTNFKKQCIDIDDEETFANGGQLVSNGVLAAGLSIEHSIVHCQANFSDNETPSDLWKVSSWFLGQRGNVVTNPMLNGWVPAVGSPLIGQGETPPDLFFDVVDFIGAIESSSKDWTRNWTSSARQ